MSLDKRIFEYRKLEDSNTGLYVSVNVYGNRFYGFFIGKEENEELYADNLEWISKRLFLLLSEHVYEKHETIDTSDVGEYLDKFTRDEKTVLYELLVTADSLGWMNE